MATNHLFFLNFDLLICFIYFWAGNYEGEESEWENSES